jgi:hypothetical protein
LYFLKKFLGKTIFFQNCSLCFELQFNSAYCKYQNRLHIGNFSKTEMRSSKFNFFTKTAVSYRWNMKFQTLVTTWINCLNLGGLIKQKFIVSKEAYDLELPEITGIIVKYFGINRSFQLLIPRISAPRHNGLCSPQLNQFAQFSG